MKAALLVIFTAGVLFGGDTLFIDTTKIVDSLYETWQLDTFTCYKKDESGQFIPQVCNRSWEYLYGYTVTIRKAMARFTKVRFGDTAWFTVDSGRIYMPKGSWRLPLTGKIGTESIYLTAKVPPVSVSVSTAKPVSIRLLSSGSAEYLLNGRRSSKFVSTAMVINAQRIRFIANVRKR